VKPKGNLLKESMQACRHLKTVNHIRADVKGNRFLVVQQEVLQTFPRCLPHEVVLRSLFGAAVTDRSLF